MISEEEVINIMEKHGIKSFQKEYFVVKNMNTRKNELCYETYLVFSDNEKLSKQEHAQSQYILGMMYQKGQAVQENQQLAFQYFKKSADKGNSDAQLMLGFLYYDGEGVEQDYEIAFEIIEKFAKKGDEIAQNKLATMYLDGVSVEQDYELAIEQNRKKNIN